MTVPVDPSLRFISYIARYKGSKTGWAENYKDDYCGRNGVFEEIFYKVGFYR